jgi:hypothetical protein
LILDQSLRISSDENCTKSLNAYLIQAQRPLICA